MAYCYGTEMEIYKGNNQNRNTERYMETLFGQRIHENPVPVWTADKDYNPFVVFRDSKNGKKIGLNKEMLSYGLITIAEPGRGKTNILNIIMEKLLTTQESNDKFIIFDTKGDYFREFAHRIPKDEVIVIGTGKEYRNITSIPNFFAEVMPRGMDGKLVYTYDSDTDALQLAKQLFANMQSQHQPIFPAMAEQIVAACLIYFMRTYWCTDQTRLNNKSFIEFMYNSSNEKLIKDVFKQEYMKDFRNCMNYISGKNNQTQGVNSYIGSVFRELFIGPFAEHDSEREFSIREVINTPGKKTVFIEYDLHRGDVLSPLYGLLLDSALSNALGGRQTNRNHIYFILDEMLLLPKLKHLSNALNFGRSQGLKLLCGLQNVSGLADVYGEKGAKCVLASFQNMVAFQNSDYDTRRFLMERMGSNYYNVSFSPQQKNINIQREGYTVEEWNLLELKQWESIISLKDERPFFFNVPEYQ